MVTNLHEAFLRLVRIGIGHTETTEITENVDWVALKALAERQGLSAIVLDALNTDDTNLTDTMPQVLRLEWIGEVLQNYEARYTAYEHAIGSLAGFYNQHGYKMMVLKGYACSLDWPKPEHRPSGDIDIWQFGEQKTADAALLNLNGNLNDNLNLNDNANLNARIEIDNSHHHHTVFYWRNFIVENHYDFINIHARRSNVRLERIFKELGADDTHFVEVYGERVYLPSANLHGLFLIRHAVAHFAAAEITLRQVLDWAFFVEKHGKEVNWPWLTGVLEEFGLKRFFDVLNVICVEDLGFQFDGLKAYGFQLTGVDKELKARVLGDIIEPEFSEEVPSRLLPRVLFRFRRWQANGWKQRLCYNESRWSAFWSGVWNHLLKPKSI